MTAPSATQTAAEISRRRALVKASPALQPYGTFEEVQELVRRFKVMCPETKEMTDSEIVAYAQVAYLHGLNPLPAVREVCWIPGIGPHIGIRGLRRKGREWADARDLGVPDLVPSIMLDAVERERQDIPLGALAYKIVGGFPALRRAWTEDAVRLRDALGPAAPWEAIIENLGPRPTVTGYGYVTKEEMDRRNTPAWWHKCPKANGKGVKHFGFDPCPDCGRESYAEMPKFSNAALAMKRAEAHWWKQATDIPFQVDPSGAGVAIMDDVPIVVEGQVREIPQNLTPAEAELYYDLVRASEEHAAKDASRSPEERQAAARAGSDALFGPSGKAVSDEQFIAAHGDYVLPGDRVTGAAPTKAESQEEVRRSIQTVGLPDPGIGLPPPVDPTVRMVQIKALWEAAGVLPKKSAKQHVDALLAKLGLDVTASDEVLGGMGRLYRDARESGSSTDIAALYAKQEWAKRPA